MYIRQYTAKGRKSISRKKTSLSIIVELPKCQTPTPKSIASGSKPKDYKYPSAYPGMLATRQWQHSRSETSHLQGRRQRVRLCGQVHQRSVARLKEATAQRFKGIPERRILRACGGVLYVLFQKWVGETGDRVHGYGYSQEHHQTHPGWQAIPL
jgi:hypothetical protein